MPVNFENTLVIGISSRALFKLEQENEIFNIHGEKEYEKFQHENEDIPLEKGTAFHLVEALLNLNSIKQGLVEVVVMSRNSAITGLRVLNSIRHYNLPITRSCFTNGSSLAPYLECFNVSLFLSKNESDVQEIVDSQKCATALIYEHPEDYKPDSKVVRIAFDADAVIFAEDSELIYKKSGLASFHEHEDKLQDIPLEEGPFGSFFKKLSKVRRELGKEYLRIAIVTARDYPSNIRVIKTLREWNIDVDEAFFLGGLPKDGILKAFNAHIFFDDQDSYVEPASSKVPSSRVPYKTSSPLKQFEPVKVDIEYLKKLGN